jgi:hypothetical protein
LTKEGIVMSNETHSILAIVRRLCFSITIGIAGKSVMLKHNLRIWQAGMLALALGIILLVGCGHSGRQDIGGTVTFSGVPLERGYIAFQPKPGTASPSAGGEIVGGKFSVSPTKGLLPGKFRVEITASRITDKKVRDRLTGDLVPLEEQYIPAKYNTASQLEITIPQEGGKVLQDFDLTP